MRKVKEKILRISKVCRQSNQNASGIKSPPISSLQLPRTSCDGTILMWDAHTRELVGRSFFDPSEGGVYRMMLSPDGHRIVATSSESVRVWDVNTMTSKRNLLCLHYEDKC